MVRSAMGAIMVRQDELLQCVCVCVRACVLMRLKTLVWSDTLTYAMSSLWRPHRVSCFVCAHACLCVCVCVCVCLLENRCVCVCLFVYDCMMLGFEGMCSMLMAHQPVTLNGDRATECWTFLWWLDSQPVQGRFKAFSWGRFTLTTLLGVLILW